MLLAERLAQLNDDFVDDWRLFGFLFILYTLLNRQISTYMLNEAFRDLTTSFHWIPNFESWLNIFLSAAISTFYAKAYKLTY